MMLPLARPNVNKRRSRRLRKKLRIAEFQELGFECSVVWAQVPPTIQQDEFLDRFVEEVVEARDLLVGGGYNEGTIVSTTKSLTDLDREAVQSWLRAFPGVVDVQVGPLVDAWYAHE